MLFLYLEVICAESSLVLIIPLIFRFEAKAIGMPKPEVRWLKQGVELQHSQEYQIEELEDGTSTLIMPEVYQDDTGEIAFEAFNPLGVTSTIAALSVSSKCAPCMYCVPRSRSLTASVSLML